MKSPPAVSSDLAAADKSRYDEDRHGRVGQDLPPRGNESGIVMMIHDALWVEAPTAEEAEVKDLMKAVMTTAGNLTVPLEVDFG